MIQANLSMPHSVRSAVEAAILHWPQAKKIAGFKELLTFHFIS